MKKTILVTFILIFISNLGLISYASESDTNKFILEQQYKKDFLISSEKDININFEDKKEDINPNIWMWSFLFPGLGQFIMGENGWGWGFFIPSFILSIFIIGSIVVVANSTGVDNWSGILIILVTIPLSVIYMILYFSSLINANQLNHSKVIASQNSIADLIERQEENEGNISEYLWLSSILIPGSGQIMQGEYFRGLLFIIFESLILITGLRTISNSQNQLLLLVVLLLSSLVHIWNIADSYQIKEKKVKDFLEKIEDRRTNRKNKRNRNSVDFKNNSLVYQVNF
ncbi:MAG: hypothetical protein U0354_10385 [Candidatus Sericytochromatia bacterium]